MQEEVNFLPLRCYPFLMVPNPASVPVFILAGGLGTRISEETTLKPKPMVEIGETPILVHIMRWYYRHGFRDFVICAGYRSWEIKQYFLTYEFRKNHLVIDHRDQADSAPASFEQNNDQERWRVRVIDTGAECMTGGRIARAFDAIQDEKFEHFAVTYGDGVSDVPLVREFDFHLKHERVGTVLAVHPSARFGELEVSDDNTVTAFKEKPQSGQDLINGGFFFFRRDFRKYLSDESNCILERTPLSQLAKDRQLRLYRHEGFWHAMDTLRDKQHLESLWQSEKAPWKT
jgi:glucose-1-phosphate cytidylyltransferase